MKKQREPLDELDFNTPELDYEIRELMNLDNIPLPDVSDFELPGIADFELECITAQDQTESVQK